MVTAARAMSSTVIDLGAFDRLTLRVQESPAASLLSLVAGAVGGYPHGVDPEWSSGLARAVAPADHAMGRAFFKPPLATIPDCLSPSLTSRESTMEAYLTRIGDLDPAQIVTDLHRDFEPIGLPSSVARLLDRPRRLRDSFRRLMTAAWQAYAPTWQRATSAVFREQERLGTCVVTGMLDAGLTSLGPRIRLIGRHLQVPDPRAEQVRINGRALVLVPLTSGPTASLLNLDDPERIWIGYPTEAAAEPSCAEGTSAGVLEMIFGTPRAVILRESASNPTMGDIAAALGVAPGAATYHCGRLETARLVERVRIGGRVRVKRTRRGDEIVELLSSGNA